MSQVVQNGRAIRKVAVKLQILVVRSRGAVDLINSVQVLTLFVRMLDVDQTLPLEKNAAASKVLLTNID